MAELSVSGQSSLSAIYMSVPLAYFEYMVSQYPGHIILALFLQCPLFGQKDPPTLSSQQELKLNHWLWRHEADVYREHLLRVNVLRVLLLTSVFVWHVVQASVLAKSYVVGTPNNS